MTSTQSIVKFNKERNLTKLDLENEYRMLEEELKELREAIDEGDTHKIIDAFNDLRVISTGAVWKAGQDPELSLKQTCKEILSRKGHIGPDGKWLKDPNQPEDTLYKADYNLSKRNTKEQQ